MLNFDTTSVPRRTVDAESLSEIAIHNFKKSEKIEIRVLQPIGGGYLFPLQWSQWYILLYTEIIINALKFLVDHYQQISSLPAKIQLITKLPPPEILDNPCKPTVWMEN